jgi:hypothetical protein
MLKLPMHLARVAMLGAAPARRRVRVPRGQLPPGRRSATADSTSQLGGGSGTQQQPEPDRRACDRGDARRRRQRRARQQRGRRWARRAGTATGGAAGSAGARTVARMLRRRPPGERRGGPGRVTGLRVAGREQDFANEVRGGVPRQTSPCRPNGPGRARELPGGAARVGQLVSDHGAGARASAYRRWAVVARQRRRCARSPPPAPTCAPRPSACLRRGREWRRRGRRRSPAGRRYRGLAAGAAGASAPEPGGRRRRLARGRRPSTPSASATASSSPGGARPPGPGSGEVPPRRSLPPAPVRRSLPPPREPRGPSPDELFPNG